MIDFPRTLVRFGTGTLVGMVGFTLVSGCASTTETTTGSGSTTSTSTTTSEMQGEGAQQQASTGEIGSATQVLSELDKTFTVGPSIAREIGFRAMWNVDATVGTSRVKRAELHGDSIFVIDTGNNLNRVLVDAAQRTWSWPVGGDVDTVLGLKRTTVEGMDALLALTEGDVHIFEVANGIQTGKQSLMRVSSTEPVLFGEFLIYGTLRGLMVWHHVGVNAYMGGNSLQGVVDVSPVLHNGIVIGVSQSGQVMAMEAGSRASIWANSARDAIVQPPAVTDEAVYVTSLDQFVRCFDMYNGRLLWKSLHSAPLRSRPIVYSDRLYVDTPDMGFVCYEALPIDDLDGNRLWSNEQVHGTAFGMHDGNLFVWDADARVMHVVANNRGELIKSVPMPKVHRLLTSQFESGTIYAVSGDGVITRLEPR